MRPTGGQVVRSMRRGDSARGQKVTAGTTLRILRFAAPYRRLLLLFLALVTVDAVIGAVSPLILRAIINNGILAGDAAVVVTLALIVAGLALVDASLSLGERFVSARVGEGLVFDMRTKIFSHIQTMPLAFFTRTQTGALVSRLNNDVLGAQEAFTDVLSSVVGNLISVTLVLIAMFVLSWQLTLVSLVLLPAFAIPARWLEKLAERERLAAAADRLAAIAGVG